MKVGLPALLALVVLWLLAGAGSTRAQAAETLTPIDAGGKLDRIDARLESSLHLFPEISGFREARLFQAEDSTFVLEITHGPSLFHRTRRPMTAAEALRFRALVTERLRALAPERILDRGGRTQLLIGTSVVSLGFYGWAVPVSAQARNETAVGLYMLTGGAGIVAPILLTRGKSVSDADATMAIYGETRGILHGISMHRSFVPEGDRYDRRRLAPGCVASVLEGTGGLLLSHRFGWSSGHAEMVSAGGDFGFGLGAAVADLADWHGSDWSTAFLLGSYAGVAGGHLLARDEQYTRGDAYLFRAAGQLGALEGLAVVTMFEDEYKPAHTAAALGGGIAGMVLGDRLAGSRDLTTSEGVLVNLTEIAGGLLGLGVAYLVGGDDDHVKYAVAGAVGAAAGFAIPLHWIGVGPAEE